MYKVIRFFTDLQDDEHVYESGDVFPREGMNVTSARLKELSSNKNLQGEPLIRLVEEADTSETVKAAEIKQEPEKPEEPKKTKKSSKKSKGE